MVPDLLIEIATRHAVHFEGAKTRAAREFNSFLRDMESDILAQLARIDDPADLSATRLRDVLNAVRTTLDSGFGDYERVWRDQLRDIGLYESEFELKALGRISNFDFAAPSPAQIMTAAFSNPLSVTGPDEGKLLEPFFRDWTGKSTQRIVNAIRLGAAQGQTTAEIVRRIRGTRRARFRDGIIEATRRDVTMMTRTALQHVAVQAREVTWARNDSVVSKVEWVSVLDGRTSSICRGLDGQQFKLDKGPRPPIHIGCRSTVVPVLRGNLALLSEGGKQFSRGPDGVKYVKGDLDYYDWLKLQSAEFQDDVLGPNRGTLLRKGGLSATRFKELQLDKQFKERTLEEMRALEPLAFDQAGI